jgi:hypothetical protein
LHNEPVVLINNVVFVCLTLRPLRERRFERRVFSVAQFLRCLFANDGEFFRFYYKRGLANVKRNAASTVAAFFFSRVRRRF